MPTQKKITQVQNLKTDLGKTKSLVVADHTGLNNQQIETLRKNVKKAGGKFTVIKNTLLKIALKDTTFSDKIESKSLSGPTSLVLSFEDEINPLKELVRLAKEYKLPKIKGGALTDRMLTENDILRISDLPPKEILLAQLLGMIKSPHTRLVFALKGNLIKLALVIKAISEKKRSN